METLTNDINVWKEHTEQKIREYDKKESFCITIPKNKIGMLGGCSIVGYIAKYTFSYDGSVTYQAAKELRSVYQSWQWHTVYADDINKRLKKDEQKYKIHSFKTIEQTIKFIIN